MRLLPMPAMLALFALYAPGLHCAPAHLGTAPPGKLNTLLPIRHDANQTPLPIKQYANQTTLPIKQYSKSRHGQTIFQYSKSLHGQTIFQYSKSRHGQTIFQKAAAAFFLPLLLMTWAATRLAAATAQTPNGTSSIGSFRTRTSAAVAGISPVRQFLQALSIVTAPALNTAAVPGTSPVHQFLQALFSTRLAPVPVSHMSVLFNRCPVKVPCGPLWTVPPLSPLVCESTGARVMNCINAPRVCVRQSS